MICLMRGPKNLELSKSSMHDIDIKVNIRELQDTHLLLSTAYEFLFIRNTLDGSQSVWLDKEMFRSTLAELITLDFGL